MVMIFLNIYRTMESYLVSKYERMPELDGKREHPEKPVSYISEKRFAKVEGYSVSYGQRWIVETVFSSIKRMFVVNMCIG